MLMLAYPITPSHEIPLIIVWSYAFIVPWFFLFSLSLQGKTASRLLMREIPAIELIRCCASGLLAFLTRTSSTNYYNRWPTTSAHGHNIFLLNPSWPCNIPSNTPFNAPTTTSSPLAHRMQFEIWIHQSSCSHSVKNLSMAWLQCRWVNCVNTWAKLLTLNKIHFLPTSPYPLDSNLSRLTLIYHIPLYWPSLISLSPSLSTHSLRIFPGLVTQRGGANADWWLPWISFQCHGCCHARNYDVAYSLISHHVIMQWRHRRNARPVRLITHSHTSSEATWSRYSDILMI